MEMKLGMLASALVALATALPAAAGPTPGPCGLWGDAATSGWAAHETRLSCYGALAHASPVDEEGAGRALVALALVDASSIRLAWLSETSLPFAFTLQAPGLTGAPWLATVGEKQAVVAWQSWIGGVPRVEMRVLERGDDQVGVRAAGAINSGVLLEAASVDRGLQLLALDVASGEVRLVTWAGALDEFGEPRLRSDFAWAATPLPDPPIDVFGPAVARGPGGSVAGIIPIPPVKPLRRLPPAVASARPGAGLAPLPPADPVSRLSPAAEVATSRRAWLTAVVPGPHSIEVLRWSADTECFDGLRFSLVESAGHRRVEAEPSRLRPDGGTEPLRLPNASRLTVEADDDAPALARPPFPAGGPAWGDAATTAIWLGTVSAAPPTSGHAPGRGSSAPTAFDVVIRRDGATRGWRSGYPVPPIEPFGRDVLDLREDGAHAVWTAAPGLTAAPGRAAVWIETAIDGLDAWPVVVWWSGPRELSFVELDEDGPVLPVETLTAENGPERPERLVSEAIRIVRERY